MEGFSLLYWKHAKSEKYAQPFLLLQPKRLGDVKNVQFLDVLIHFTIVKAQLLAYIFSRFPHCLQILIAIVTCNTVLCHHHLMEKNIKNSFLKWKLLPGSVPSQNLPVKTTTSKHERKLPVKRQITS